MKDARLADKFIVRLPDGMRDEIKEASLKNRRSMNSEIVARLGSFGREDATPTLEKRLETVERMLGVGVVQ
jgi:hypothetical protein